MLKLILLTALSLPRWRTNKASRWNLFARFIPFLCSMTQRQGDKVMDTKVKIHEGASVSWQATSFVEIEVIARLGAPGQTSLWRSLFSLVCHDCKNFDFFCQRSSDSRKQCKGWNDDKIEQRQLCVFSIHYVIYR